MRRVLALVLSLAVIFSAVSVSASASSFDIDFDTTCSTLYLVNEDTGVPVYAKNESEKRYPASTTKIMTYIVVAENVNDLKNTKVEIKYDIIHSLDGTGSSMSGLEDYIGKKLSVYDLLCCLMIKSGNDAAVVLADYVGGSSESKFVEKMNAKAAELGCSNTHFVNPHGLHDDNHYTTAEDMYKIAYYAKSLPYFTEIVSESTYYLPESDYPLVATNYLIDAARGGEYYYPYATGIKTGTTDEAGFCLVSSATRGGYSYICIAFGAPCYDSDGDWMDTNGAMIDSVELYQWAFENLEIKQVVKKETPVCSVKLDYAWNKDSLLLVPEKNFSTVMPYSVDVSSIDITPNVPESVKAPVKKGDIIGTASISYANSELTTINLVASESVEASDMVKITDSVKTVALSNWVLIPACIVIILFAIYIAVATVYKKRMERLDMQKRKRQ